MNSYNRVVLIGNLTRDPELRYTPKGTAVARLNMAMNRKWRNNSGETQEDVTYVEVDTFGKQAETLGKYMKKGKPLLVEGRLRFDSWEDKETGKKRSQLRVVLEQFSFLPSGGDRSEQGAPAAPSRESSAAPASRGAGYQGAEDDDDVPF